VSVAIANSITLIDLSFGCPGFLYDPTVHLTDVTLLPTEAGTLVGLVLLRRSPAEFVDCGQILLLQVEYVQIDEWASWPAAARSDRPDARDGGVPSALHGPFRPTLKRYGAEALGERALDRVPIKTATR
jgi:hypothetical protein